tara:strand:- start:64 stop:324 length:261 start_codon:yes stop_codon:yes gene_type:complete
MNKMETDDTKQTEDNALEAEGDSVQTVVNLPNLSNRFKREFMDAANLTKDELFKCCPQEMALFGFLVGSGMTWDEARKAENLDILG